MRSFGDAACLCVSALVLVALGCSSSDASESSGPNGTGGSDGGMAMTTVSSNVSSGGTNASASSTSGASSSSSNGSGGESGSTSTGMDAPQIAVLGEPCDEPAALACAGQFQKVTLICDSGTWRTNQTCAGDDFCDSTPGPNAGTCQASTIDCEGHQPGDRFCVGAELRACGPDTVNATLIEDCGVGCTDAECFWEGCPTREDAFICSEDCGGPTERCDRTCPFLFFAPEESRPSVRIVLRTPAASDACVLEGSCGSYYFSLGIAPAADDPPRRFRASVQGDWALDCGTASCEIIDELNRDGNYVVTLWASNPEAAPSNVLIEEVGEGEGCP